MTAPTQIPPNALLDPVRFERIPGAAVFRTHRRETTAADGSTQVIDVDEARLHRIAEKSNALLRSEVYGRLTDGHTLPTTEQKGQPDLLGFVSGYRVAPGPDGTPWLWADEYVPRNRPKLRERLANRPYRSSEYYPDTDEIRGVAALITDPVLDLGMRVYGRGESPVLYGRTSFPVPYGVPPMNDEFAGGEAPKPDPEKKKDEPTTVTLSDEDKAWADAVWDYLSTTNAALKAMMAEMPAEGTDNPSPVAYGRQAFAAMATRVAALETHTATSEVEGVITRARAARVAFDEAAERTRLTKMAPTARADHERLMMTCYGRVPGGPGAAPLPVTQPVEGKAGASELLPLTSAQAARVTSLMHKRGLTFSEAEAAVRKDGI